MTPRHTGRTVIDMSAVTFLDSYGVAALIKLQRAARARRGKVTLAGPAPAALRILRIMRLDALFDITSSRGESR